MDIEKFQADGRSIQCQIIFQAVNKMRTIPFTYDVGMGVRMKHGPESYEEWVRQASDDIIGSG